METEFDAFAEDFAFWRRTLDPHRYDQVVSFVPQSADRALDAGCGSEVLALHLAEHVRQVVGADISHSLISLAKKRQEEQGKDNVDFVIADIKRLPFRADTFDFVASWDVLHLPGLETALPDLQRMVKPGGRMAIRESVSSTPRLDRSPIWRIFLALKGAPGYAGRYGLRAMVRLVSFLTSRAWLRHVRRQSKLKPEEFQRIYSRFLPGCRSERSRTGMTAFWEAPETGDQT